MLVPIILRPQITNISSAVCIMLCILHVLCEVVDTSDVLVNSQVRIDHRNGTLHFGSQQLESDKVRNHLALLAKRLAKAGSMMDPGVNTAAEERKHTALKLAREHMASEHRRLVARKQVIEKRKEQQEQLLMEQVRHQGGVGDVCV
jgi:hypothetical protein